MTTRKKATLVLVAVIIAAVLCSAIRIYYILDYEWDSVLVARFESPDGNQAACLVLHGMLMGTTLTFLISPSGSVDDLRWIGTVGGQDVDIWIRELAWSKDGTLVAARCSLGGYFKKLPEGKKDDCLFTHGYDFESSTRLVPKGDGFDEAPAAWIERHGKIQQLFAEKGGQQVCLSISPGGGYPPTLGKVTWFELHQWRNRLRAAMKQERGY